MAAYYRRNDAGWARIATSPTLRRTLDEIGRKAQAYAESIAPYDPTPDNRGHYKNSFRLEATTTTIGGFRRASIRLHNDAAYAAAVEWGYRRRKADPAVDAHRILGRTLASLAGAT